MPATFASEEPLVEIEKRGSMCTLYSQFVSKEYRSKSPSPIFADLDHQVESDVKYHVILPPIESPAEELQRLHEACLPVERELLSRHIPHKTLISFIVFHQGVAQSAPEDLRCLFGSQEEYQVSFPPLSNSDGIDAPPVQHDSPGEARSILDCSITDLASLVETHVTATPVKQVTAKPKSLRPPVAIPLTYAKALGSCAPPNAMIPAVEVHQKAAEKHAQEEATETSAEC